jgi:hypothetical protein
MNNKKFFGGKKKKEVCDMVKNGRDFKLIIIRAKDDAVESIMEKPNIKTWAQNDFNTTISGAHVFALAPEQNHVDFFKEGTLIHKEYPEIRGSTNYGYTLSGSAVII